MRSGAVYAIGVFLLAGPAVAAPVSFSGAAWQANGSASIIGPNALQLTNDYDQAGSAFATTRISTAQSFTLGYNYTLSGIYTHDPRAPQADGVGFVLQSSLAGPAALGAIGGQLGYGGIGPSVAVLMRSWFNDRLQISSGGDILSGPSTAYSLGFHTMDAGTVNVTYDALAHLLTATATPAGGVPATLSETVDLSAELGPLAWFGFTGATQVGASTQVIGDLSIATSIPEPAGLAVFAAGLLAMAGLRAPRRR